ncbi:MULTISPECIES: lactate dehydrogenase [Rhodococcus]|uniref:lactate/malate family dehydrogenase n=1 Tax=Rhodococcus TaxID=1827 RepID=UPI000C9A260F|nr:MULTISPECIES: lactate dehydrogenase [Rhodococcus]PND51411.1 lactate dehydrogenase [Rhodococcus sp. ENV425]WKX01133.1 lactate dehydrogenase [Rhodococcus aetherivorans]
MAEGVESGGAPARAVVVGAGHVGMISAMRLADADVFDEVVLVDVEPGLAAGIALDLTHTGALTGSGTRVRGAVSLEEAGPADYVIITAGKARRPGMSRSDLTATNARIVGDVAGRAAAVSPDVVLVVVTNPLDEMTYQAWRSSGLPAEQVLGMAGLLDAGRFRALAAADGAGGARELGAVALGSHGEEMVIPLSQAPEIAARLDAARLDELVDRTRTSGAEVLGLLKSGSAFFGPGTAAAHMVLAMVADSGTVVSATVRPNGEYGIGDVFVGLPVVLGRRGVRRIVELDLTPEELELLREAAKRIGERIAGLPA